MTQMFAAIYLPDFALQSVLRLDPAARDIPIALVDGALKSTVLHMTPPARLSGVLEGMSAPQALARCPAIRIFNRSMAAEKAAHETLQHVAGSFSPFFEATAADLCTLDLKGQRFLTDTPALKPAALSWAEQIQTVLSQVGLLAQIGLASAPLLAQHAARSPAPRTFVDDPHSFWSTLPVASLNPSEELRQILRSWGIRTVAAFLQLEKMEMSERLGPEGLALWESASPSALRPLRLASLPERFHEGFEFEKEIESLEPVLFILRRFLEQLSRRCEMAGRVAEEMALRLLFTDGPVHERTFKIPSPTRQAGVLFRILHTHLETVRNDHPLRSVALELKPCDPPQQQLGLFEPKLRDPNHFYETLARLAALVGRDRAGTPVLAFSYRPDAYRIEPLRFGSASAHAAPAEAPPLPVLGPCLRRFRPPLPAAIEWTAGRPAAFHATRCRGRIIAAVGPWVSSGDWWDHAAWQREEWDIQTQDGLLYRLSIHDQQSFVEGAYD